jgi:lipopolysaccharide transport system permease protein
MSAESNQMATTTAPAPVHDDQRHADGQGSSMPARLVEPVVVEASRGLFRLRLGELMRYHELLFFLTWRDIKVRYKQTALGFAWAVLQPLLTMVVFTIFFGRVAGIEPPNDIPYTVFSLAAIVLWMFFANSLINSSASLVASASMLTKVYFPRLAIPIATTLGGAIDFGVAFLLLFVFMAAYGVAPTEGIVAAPVSVLIVFVSAIGVGLLLSALNVRFRDVRFVVPVLVQLWMLTSPIAYSASSLEQPWITLYGLNPIAGAVETFRWGMLGAPAPPLSMVVVSTLSAFALLGLGAIVFGRMERDFADVV